jgi:hypothetical protein
MEELRPCVLNAIIRKQSNESEEMKAIEKEFPREWDWRDIDGKNWLQPVDDQSDCGSCYVVGGYELLF